MSNIHNDNRKETIFDNIYQELLDGSLKHFLLAHEKTYGEGHKYVRQMNEIMNQLTYELTQKKWEGLFDGTT